MSLPQPTIQPQHSNEERGPALGELPVRQHQFNVASPHAAAQQTHANAHADLQEAQRAAKAAQLVADIMVSCSPRAVLSALSLPSPRHFGVCLV